MNDMKVGVVVRHHLEVWQEVNVGAFLSVGIAAGALQTIREQYEDGSGNTYLPIFTEPLLVFVASADQLQRTRRRALSRNVRLAIYARTMFATSNDVDNRAVVRQVSEDDLDLVGVALLARRS